MMKIQKVSDMQMFSDLRRRRAEKIETCNENIHKKVRNRRVALRKTEHYAFEYTGQCSVTEIQTYPKLIIHGS